MVITAIEVRLVPNFNELEGNASVSYFGGSEGGVQRLRL